jgi:hypothetical protein
VYDISMTQIMQERVDANVRGSVGGTQTALNAVFELLPNLLAMIYDKPNQFYVLVIAGYLSVFIAMLLYARGVYWQRWSPLPSSESDNHGPRLKAKQSDSFLAAGIIPN